MKIWAVVLAGGVGSRFWPLSTPSRPKQLLPLVDSRPLLQATLDRLRPIVDKEHILILTNASLVPPMLSMLDGVTEENLIAEPRPAGTAAALTWAALEVARRGGADDVMVCVHADWSIGDEEGFRSALLQAAEVAKAQDKLVTVGVVPSRPDPGFGYIQPGAPLGDSGSFGVERFVEKPDRENARRMCDEGYLWNSGIFVWKASVFLEQVRRHTPEVAPAMQAGASLEDFFASVSSVSVDVGVLERSTDVAVMPGDFGWDDIGTWAALSRVIPHDSSGNAIRGEATVVQSENNVVFTEGARVVLYGVKDLVVVNCAGVTLVTTAELAADLKSLLEVLPPDVLSR